MSHPLLNAFAGCVAALLGEVLFMGRDGNRYMKSLRQPSFAPPLWAWSMIGLGYYAICFLTIYRLTGDHGPHSLPDQRALPLTLLIVVMTANSFWNYIYFRRHDLRLVFLYSAGYALVVLALVVVLFRTDIVSAMAFAVYAAYLPYALALFYRTYRLNVPDQRASAFISG